jgi:lipopolysaccharide export system permease protein
MKSSGISLWRILSPLIIIGFIISTAVFIINDRVIPVSSRISNMIRRDELEKDKFKEKRQSVINSVAIYGSGNRIIFARNYDVANKTLEDIIIHEHDKKANLISKITAQSGVWTGEGWKFNKVIMWRIDNSGKILGDPEFANEKIVPLKERPNDFANREWKSEYMTYRELGNYIRNFRGAGVRIVRALLVDLHYKVSFALISLIIIVIGAPFALITTRGGVLIGIGMSIVIGLLYYAFIAIALALGKGGMLPPFVAAWIGNVVFACIGVYLVNKRA